jgi:hypothetical protein
MNGVTSACERCRFCEQSERRVENPGRKGERFPVNNAVTPRRRMVSTGSALLAGLVFVSSANAAEPCGLCDEEIVTNSVLASCFLDEYQQFAAKANGAVVVDLSNCEAFRGVIEPLPTPGIEVEEPDVRFMLTRTQLDCLKGKLEQPGLVLDPSAKIQLDSCG